MDTTTPFGAMPEVATDFGPRPEVTTAPATEAPPRHLRPSLGLTQGVSRLATGAASLFAFGLACGSGAPSVASVGHAAELVSTPVLFALFFAPSLWVILTLFDQPIEARAVATASADGVSAMGSLLLGLVPAAVFFELTAGGDDGRDLATFLEFVAFCFAGAVGLARFRARLVDGNGGPSVGFAFLAFAALAVVFVLNIAPRAFLALI